jgi:hypothetical protein
MSTLASEFDLWLDQLGRRRLESELGAIEARLGTPAEYPDDLECARAIARRMNNLLLTQGPQRGLSAGATRQSNFYPGRKINPEERAGPQQEKCQI